MILLIDISAGTCTQCEDRADLERRFIQATDTGHVFVDILETANTMAIIVEANG